MENGNCAATFVLTLVAIGVECQNTWALAGIIAFLLWVESCRE